MLSGTDSLQLDCHNRCYTTFTDFNRDGLSFLREDMPRN